MKKEDKQKLKDEFGIHFKDSPDELQFLEAFIEELLKQERKEIFQLFVRGAIKYGSDTQELLTSSIDKQIENLNKKRI